VAALQSLNSIGYNTFPIRKSSTTTVISMLQTPTSLLTAALMLLPGMMQAVGFSLVHISASTTAPVLLLDADLLQSVGPCDNHLDTRNSPAKEGKQLVCYQEAKLHMYVQKYTAGTLEFKGCSR
jgi:hypothetical protein